MKILHTADWHLGQTFYEYDRREEHLHFLEWLKPEPFGGITTNVLSFSKRSYVRKPFFANYHHCRKS